MVTVKGGFSFCGIDIADIGLEYAPENKDTYVYAPAETNIHEETFEGHDGGYSYGASKQPKTFTLRCFYDNKHIAKGLMSKVFDLFRVGRKGLLVFQRRPWIYYYCTVTAKPDITEMYSYLNGLVTIEMKAYYPFGRGINVTKDETDEEAHKHLFYNITTDPCHDEIMKNTAVLEKEYMVPQMSFSNASISAATINNQSSDVHNPILLYNPGTERAKIGLVITGKAGDGVVIRNLTTDQSCRYVAFDTEGYIYTDGINGKTIIHENSNDTLAFLYHDYGFIELEPAFPIVRDLYVKYSGDTVDVTNILYGEEEEKEWYKNKYIYLDNWYKIHECVDKHTLKLYSAAGTGACKTCAVLMNEIQIVPTQDTLITNISFIYKPTYS